MTLPLQANHKIILILGRYSQQRSEFTVGIYLLRAGHRWHKRLARCTVHVPLTSEKPKLSLV